MPASDDQAPAATGARGDPGDRPPEGLRYRRRLGVRRATRRVWDARGMVGALAQRSLRSRYKRSLLGWGWVLLAPLGYLLVFTVLFNRVAKVDTGGVPYPLFVYSALVPWQFFSSAVSSGSQSILGNLALVNKLRAPADIYPLATTSVAAVDTGVAALVLPVLFVVDGRWPTSTVLLLPIVIVVHLVVTAGPVLLLAGLVPYVRDLRPLVPFALQLGILITPIAYSLDSVAPQWQLPMSVLNPMAPVVDSYRRCLVMGEAPQWGLLGAGALSGLALLVIAVAAFRRLEVGLADVA